MTTENKLKRVRAPNWEMVEKKLLREIIKEYVDVIENKCTDTNTNKSKLQAWQKVCQRFNELNIKQRSLVELKQQWRISKIDAKKKISEHRIAQKKTGGGSRPPSPGEEIYDLVKLLPLEFEVDHNKFDSDASVIKVQNNMTPEHEEGSYLDETPSQDVHLKSHVTVPDTNLGENLIMPHRKRKLAKNPHLTVKRKSEASQIVECANLRNKAVAQCLQEEHELKLRQMVDLHDMKLKQLAESHEWTRQEHVLRLKLLEKQLKTNN